MTSRRSLGLKFTRAKCNRGAVSARCIIRASRTQWQTRAYYENEIRKWRRRIQHRLACKICGQEVSTSKPLERNTNYNNISHARANAYYIIVVMHIALYDHDDVGLIIPYVRMYACVCLYGCVCVYGCVLVGIHELINEGGKKENNERIIIPIVQSHFFYVSYLRWNAKSKLHRLICCFPNASSIGQTFAFLMSS